MSWQIKFYEKVSGESPVEDFLTSLPSKLLAKTLHEIDLLKEFGTSLREPHVKNIGDGIWELRTQLRNDLTRIFYFTTSGKIFVMLHGFVKKTRTMPSKEFEIARERMKDQIRRYGK